MVQKRLRRELGLFQVTTAGVGVILGAGIYVLIGIAAQSSGNATWLAFFISSLVALFTGLSYAELSSMFKGDAAEYDYVKAAFNKSFAFVIALSMIIGTIISSSTVALGFAGYLTQISPISFGVSALLLLVFMSYINFVGIKQASFFNIFSTAIEFFGLLIIIFIGFSSFGSVDYLDMPFGISGVFSSAALVFFAYLGFEGIVKLRDETKNPSKNIPLGIIYAIIISSVLYIMVALSAVSLIGWKELSASSAPLALAVSAVLGSKVFFILVIIALFSTANTVLITMVAASRQIYGMSINGSLPKVFSRVHKKTKTPLFAVIITLLITLAFIIIGNIGLVANLANLFILIAFAFVNLSLIILRYKCRNSKRGFICPGNIKQFSVIALLGFISSIFMIFFIILNLL
jgi:APA family basic amino acid/polyamine antiporter